MQKKKKEITKDKYTKDKNTKDTLKRKRNNKTKEIYTKDKINRRIHIKQNTREIKWIDKRQNQKINKI